MKILALDISQAIAAQQTSPTGHSTAFSAQPQPPWSQHCWERYSLFKSTDKPQVTATGSVDQLSHGSVCVWRMDSEA